jgi:HEAT repeat protein
VLAWPLALATALIFVAGCGSPEPERQTGSGAVASVSPPAPVVSAGAGRREVAREAMRRAQATPEQVRDALGDPDRYGRVNAIYLLYLSRDKPWAVDLARGIWREDPAVIAGLGWGPGPRAAERVAAALTLSRVGTDHVPEYLHYLRSQLDHGDEFVRAQAAIALGFSGTDRDVPSLEALARSATRYDAEAAIKGLAIRGSAAARDALLALWRDYADGEAWRRTVIRQMLVEQFPEAVPGAGSGRLLQAPPDPG